MKVITIPTGLLRVNTYLVGDEQTGKALVIDPGGNAKAIFAAAGQKQWQIERILITHAHFDHIGGADELRDLTDVDISVPIGEENMAADPVKNCSYSMLGRPVVIQNAVKTIRPGEELFVGSMKVTALSVPGHSPAGMAYLVEDAVFTGDTLMAGTVGRTDLGGGSADKLFSSIRIQLFSLPDDTVVYYGHTGQTTVGQEKKYNPFVGE